MEPKSTCAEPCHVYALLSTPKGSISTVTQFIYSLLSLPKQRQQPVSYYRMLQKQRAALFPTALYYAVSVI